MSNFYPIDISQNQEKLQSETLLLQIDYSSDLEKQLSAQTQENKTLSDILATNSDVLIVRHLPSLEISHKFASYLYQYYADVYEVVLNEGRSEEAEGFDGILIASRIAISSPEKISFGTSIKKSFIEFTMFVDAVSTAELFILNDEVAAYDDSLKLEQLNSIAERAESIAVNGYQMPCVLCVKSCCFPGHIAEPRNNRATGKFIGEEGAIQECMKLDSRQNFALLLTKTTSFQDFDVNFGYEVTSKINAFGNSKFYASLSSVKLMENSVIIGSNFGKITKSSFASVKLQARDDREASVSVERDYEGNTKVEGSISVSRDNDDGSRFEIYGSGSIERDSDGNTSGSVKAGGSIKW